MKTAKMNLLYKPSNGVYQGRNHCVFCFAGRVGKEEFKQYNSWEDCRELMCGLVKDATINGGVYTSERMKQKIRELDRTRIAVFFHNPPRQSPSAKKRDRRMILSWVKRSLALLNFCEKICGFKRTRLYNVNREEVAENRHYFIFEGDYGWMKAMPLLSLYMLIIRAGRFQELSGPFESFQDVQDSLEKLAKEFKGIEKASLISNEVYRKGWPFASITSERAKIRTKIFILSRLEVIMRERKNIFSTMEENYKETREMQHGIAGLTGYGGSMFPKGEMKARYKKARRKYKFKNLLQ